MPGEVLGLGARDPEVAALVARVESAFRAGVPASGPWAQLFGSVWLRATGTWADRLRHLHECLLVPHPPDYGWVSLPAWAGAAYYLVRPVRLLAKHPFAGLLRGGA